FKEPGVPQEVRIPLHEIASLSYGWGWGAPPRSLDLKAIRLATLAGMPGSQFGQVRLVIPREDPPAARRLVAGIAPAPSDGSGPGSADALFDHEKARLEARAPAVGLLAASVVTLLSGPLIFLVQRPPLFVEGIAFIQAADLFYWSMTTVVSSVLMMGAVNL